MTVHYGYLAVEGPHDLDFTGKLLRRHNLNFIDKKEDVDPFWHKLIPTKFPHMGELGRPVPVPAFYQSDTHSIAISRAGSDSRLVNDIMESFAVLDGSKIDSVGILADADRAPAERQFSKITSELGNNNFVVPPSPGEVVTGTPQVGMFILPDNSRQGTLEDVLLQVGHKSYQKLHLWATRAVNIAPVSSLKSKERKPFKKPAGRKKATLALMANILKPGMAIQNSFRQNAWITDKSINQPLVSAYNDFLVRLFKL